jgi:hypothetical protein
LLASRGQLEVIAPPDAAAPSGCNDGKGVTPGTLQRREPPPPTRAVAHPTRPPAKLRAALKQSLRSKVVAEGVERFAQQAMESKEKSREKSEAYIKQLRMMELQRRIKERSRASRREEAASKTLPTKVSAPSQKNACAGAGVRVTRLGACA